MRSFNLLAIALFTLPFFTFADHHGLSSRHHNSLAHRKRGDLQTRETHSNARATFYDTGLGACGKWNNPGDFIVALNQAQFGFSFPSSWCWKSITIQCNGKTTQATITDSCPGCPWGGLDMSRGLFTFFAPESVGVLSVTWWTNDGGAPPPPSNPAPAPPKPAAPSSTWAPPPSSSVWVNPSSAASTASSWSPSSSSYSAPASSSKVSASSSAPSKSSSGLGPTATSSSVYGTTGKPQNLQSLNTLVGELGKFVAQYGL